MLLLTLRQPILVIAACSHISYAGNTHNNHIIASLRRTSRNLLTLPWPILVIASCSHISYAGNTRNNHKITSLSRTSRNHVRFKLHPRTTMPCWSGNKASLFTPSTSHTGTLASTEETNTERGGGGGIHPKIKSAHYQRPPPWSIFGGFQHLKWGTPSKRAD